MEVCVSGGDPNKERVEGRRRKCQKSLCFYFKSEDRKDKEKWTRTFHPFTILFTRTLSPSLSLPRPPVVFRGLQHPFQMIRWNQFWGLQRRTQARGEASETESAAFLSSGESEKTTNVITSSLNCGGKVKKIARAVSISSLIDSFEHVTENLL